jgi:hypothetical protein
MVMKLDLDAPIVPGISAAGILLGALLTAVLATNAGVFQADRAVDQDFQPGGIWYRSPDVDFWAAADSGEVLQIMVHGGYRGWVLDHIGLGSTVADIESTVGPCGEDDEDNLTIMGLPGLCFEIDGRLAAPNWRHAPIIRFFVYREMPAPQQIQREARQRLRLLIQDFVNGTDRTIEQVHRIETLLVDRFQGTAIVEETWFYLKKYSPLPGGPGRIDGEVLADVLLYVWAMYLDGEDDEPVGSHRSSRD